MTQENLLLREDGYPHLPLPEVKQFNCTYCGDSGDVHRADGEWLGQCSCATGLEITIEALRQENAQLRELLCLRSSSSTHMPYMDDGELQDNSAFPCIDYKRDSVAEIISKLQQRTLKALEANNQCRCQQLGDFCNGEHHPLCRKGGAA